jgi:antitoxin component of RelBE/YafQ-DinJ toxin-antitoxin module
MRIKLVNMSKETLNLTIESSIKKKAKRIASQKGISVSKLFERAIESEAAEVVFTPRSGSAVERLLNAIPEAEKNLLIIKLLRKVH